MIPNIGFWKETPGLVKDGFKFLFACGRRTSVGYTDITSTKTGVAEVTEPTDNPFSGSDKSNNKGYGAI